MTATVAAVSAQLGSSPIQPSCSDPDSPLGAFVAAHPSIDRIDVIVDGRVVETVATVTMPHKPDGASYAGFTVPSDVCAFTLDYLSGSQIVTTDHRTVC